MRSIFVRYDTVILASITSIVMLGFLFMVTDFVGAQAGNVVEQRREQLKSELQKIEQQIGVQQQLLGSKQQERVSLERDVSILDAKIEKAQLGIRARNIAIEQLSDTIIGKGNTIESLTERLEREREAMAQLLRKTNEIDDLSVVEIILSNKNLSDFFEELDDFQAVKIALQGSFDEIEETKEAVAAEKALLESKRIEEVELRSLQELEKDQVEQQESEKQRILNITKGEEAEYQDLLKQSERTAAEIRAELFALRDSRAIPFGTALELATRAGNITKVRPALILGVLTQETKLGENLGTGSYLTDMHPTRDKPLYLVITQNLGLNPSDMPVSRKPGYGWGGAMGPGQFIPSTWACYGGYINTVTGDCNNSQRNLGWDAFWAGPWVYDASKDRLRVISGKSSPSNPWDNQDAFLATAVLMKDNGADRGSRNAERLAALRYFAGWNNANNPSYAFYGDGVMGHADYYQRQIDILGQN